VALAIWSLDDINSFSNERPATMYSSLLFCATISSSLSFCASMFGSKWPACGSFKGVPSDCVRPDYVEGVVYAVPSQVVVITSIEGDQDDDDASDDDDPRNVGVLRLRLDASTSWSDGSVLSFCFFLSETSKLGGTFRIRLLVLWNLGLG
jgi:hypothetical protein